MVATTNYPFRSTLMMILLFTDNAVHAVGYDNTLFNRNKRKRRQKKKFEAVNCSFSSSLILTTTTSTTNGSNNNSNENVCGDIQI